MRETWLIGSNVFRQLLRNRILVVLLLFALSFVGVAMFLGYLGQDTQIRLTRDFGLLAIEAVGFFTVLLCHVVLLFEETELRTISILFVKPIRRWQYMAGKVLGSAFLLLLNQGAMLLLLVGIQAYWGIPTLVDGSFLLASVYLFLSGILFSIVAVFFTIYASTVPACAVYASFVFGIGHFTTNLLEWVNRLDQPLLKKLITGLYYLVPNFSLFNLKDNVTAIQLLLQGSSADFFAVDGQSSVLIGPPSAAPYVWPLLYLLSYGSLLLMLSLWRYERKEY